VYVSLKYINPEKGEHKMYCCNCGRELPSGTKFCTCCGAEQTATQIAPAQEAPSVQPEPALLIKQRYDASPGSTPKNFKSRYMLFAALGTAAGAVLLAIILFAAGVFSSGGNKIEGSGFATPEDAAKAYLTALRNRDMDTMLAAFAVETYVDHYDFEAMVERLNSYNIKYELRFPNTNSFNRRMNVEGRRHSIAEQIQLQYMLYNAPDALSNGATFIFKGSETVSDFVEDFEHSTGDYVFNDLKINTVISSQDLAEDQSPEDLAEDLLKDAEKDLPEDLLEDLPEDALESMMDKYLSESNQKNIERQAKIFGADIEDVANVAVVFEAGGKAWIFCPQAIRYNGRWYLQTLQGNVAILCGMSSFTGGIAPLE
jgi:hypothetical protein